MDPALPIHGSVCKDKLEPPHVGCYDRVKFMGLRPLEAEESDAGVERLGDDDLASVGLRKRS
jgi:hypothetical protein